MSCFQLDSCTRPGDHIRMAAKLSADEASAYLGVSRTTFYKRVRKGLPVVQIGARTVFDAVDLDAWAEQHKAVPRAPAVVRPPVRSFKPEPAPGTCYIDEAGKLRLWPEASTLGRERGR
ncbi:MAG TPA: helix-turn-helix domain-containing protein [Polyangiaceae bacterium]|nr:helix-turn-helix domain-containing protein [Polyangiaceae bacterium]